MKQILITIAAVVLVGCGESQQSAPTPETQPSEPVAEATKPTTPPKAVTANKGADPARGINPEPPKAKAPRISIHHAAGAAGRKGNIEVVKQHLAAGTDVDARDKEDKTPLKHAAYRGYKEIVELLIAKGADVNAKDEDGRTALDWAHGETAALLRNHGGKRGVELKAEQN